MEGNPENPPRYTLETDKDWILANCPNKKGEVNFLHEGKKVFYQYIDFPRISPLVHMGDLIFYVDSDGAQERDLLLLRDIKTGKQKIGYVIPVKLDQKGNEKRNAKITSKSKIKPLSDVLIIKYAAGDEEYLYIDDFDIFKIVNCIYKK
jgi:hypothetical protein